MYKKSNNYSPKGAQIANSPAKLDALQIGARVKKAWENKGLTPKEMTGKLFILRMRCLCYKVKLNQKPTKPHDFRSQAASRNRPETNGLCHF